MYCIINELISYVRHKEGLSGDPVADILYEIFTVVEFCFFAAFFYYIVSNNIIKKWLPIITCIFITSAFIDHFFVLSKSFTSGIQAVLILSMCIYYFFDQLKNPKFFLIYNNFNFWIIISFLIYVAGTFFLYIMAENIVPSKSFWRSYVIINFSFNLLKNILLSVAMLMREEKSVANNYSSMSLKDDWNSGSI